MRQLGMVAAVVSLLIMADALTMDDVIAQEKSLEEQLVGAWIYVSSTSTRADGSKTENSNQNAIVIYTREGHFAFVSARADLPRLANPDRALAIAEEAKAVSADSIAPWGLIKTHYHLAHGGRAEVQEPRTLSGVTLDFVWRRAK